MPTITNRSDQYVNVVDSKGNTVTIGPYTTQHVSDEVAQLLSMSPYIHGVPFGNAPVVQEVEDREEVAKAAPEPKTEVAPEPEPESDTEEDEDWDEDEDVE